MAATFCPATTTGIRYGQETLTGIRFGRMTRSDA